MFKLAEGSTKAAGQITQILQDIQGQSQLASKCMADGVNEVQGGTKAAEEAQVVFTRILDTDRELDNQVQEITGDVQKMIVEIKKVEEMSVNIAAIAEQSSAGSQEVAATIEEQTANIEEILASTATLAEMAENLKETVRLFKL